MTVRLACPQIPECSVITLNRTERAATFLILTLLGAITVGICSVWWYADTASVTLLVASVFVAFGLVVATAFILAHLRRLSKVQNEFMVPMARVWKLLSFRQWLTLMVGLTVVAMVTSTMAAAAVVAADRIEPSPTQATPPQLSSPTEASTPTEVPQSQTFSPSPSWSASPSNEPSTDISNSAVPRPNATMYLDTVHPLSGGYNVGAVSFSSRRYPRSMTFGCSAATSSYVQWNVAGAARFEATAGIADDTEDAFGAVAELIFYDQDGRQLTPNPVDVSVGHPQKVSLDLHDVVNLRLTCAGRDSKTAKQRYTPASLGDAFIVGA